MERIRFDRGYISLYFTTDVKSQQVGSEKPLVLLLGEEMHYYRTFLFLSMLLHMPAGLYSSSLKTSTAKLPQPVSLTSCMGSCKCALSNTWRRRYRESILGDQAILTGSTILTDELNIKLRRGTPDRLGSTGSDRHEGGRYLPEWQGGEGPIQARCERIRSVLNNPTTGEYDRTRSQEHLAKLCGGVSVIKAVPEDWV